MTDDETLAEDSAAEDAQTEDSTAEETPADDPAAEESTAEETSTEDVGSRERIEQAIEEVRREALKAATIHAVVDGVLVILAVNFLLTVLGLDVLGAGVQPVVAVVAGLLVGGGEFAYRFRTPPVEQFEAVNPEVSEALRTARDAALDGQETRVARRLYDDVLAGLQSASSTDLLSTGRVLVSVVLVFGLALGTVHASVVGIDLTASPDPVEAGNGTDDPDRRYEGLQDGEAILGDATGADGGDDELEAVVGGSSGGETDERDVEDGYDSGGFSSDGSYDAQQAGFSQSDDVENADIIREYNLRIRDGGENQDR